MELASLRQNISSARNRQWIHAVWYPAILLLDKKNGLRETVYDTNYDREKYELIAAGDHDHCDICWLTFSKAREHLQKGYFSGEGWICETCYGLFIDTDDPEKNILALLHAG